MMSDMGDDSDVGAQSQQPEKNGLPGRHLVKSFDQDIGELTNLITRMGGIVEQQTALAVRAIVDRDEQLAIKAIEQDEVVDRLEEEIDQLAIKLLATRQPMAIDLRIISMSLKLSNDLERIGDYAKSIAKRARRINEQPLMKPIVLIPNIGGKVQLMVNDVLDAFVERDPAKAMAVWRRDPEVDNLYDSLFRELITFILEDPRRTSVCIDLLFVAKNLERIGDHATNIAEKIHYMVHGVQINWTRAEA